MSEHYARRKVREAIEALEDWADDLDAAETAEAAAEDARLGAWEAALNDQSGALRRALEWARDPNPAMGREEQRLVLRTLLFDMDPNAPYVPVAALAARMLP